MDGVQLWSHYEETVYFLSLSPQEFMVLILLNSEGKKFPQWFYSPNGLHPELFDWEFDALTTRPLLYPNLQILILCM